MRLLFIVLIVVIGVAHQWPQPMLTYLAIAISIGVVGCAAFALIVAYLLRCKAGGGRMLFAISESPPFFNPDDHRRTILRATYQCMYCGQRYLRVSG